MLNFSLINPVILVKRKFNIKIYYFNFRICNLKQLIFWQLIADDLIPIRINKTLILIKLNLIWS